MRLLVLGDGLLARSIREVAPDAILVPHTEFDIRFTDSIKRVLGEHKPDVVVNTVALHVLNRCEDDPDLAFDVNARGAERVARLIPTIYISTDYVFNDGGPHDESLPGQQPRSVYGRSKLAGELATLEQGGIVVRVSALYGHYPSRAKGNTGFPDKLLQSHDPITLPTDQVFSPTYAPHAAWRIAYLALDMFEGFGQRSGIYHATNKGSLSWAEWAEQILAMSGHDRHVLPYIAKDPLRGSNTALKSTRLPPLPHYLGGLTEYLRRTSVIPTVSPLRG